ncbi:MAG TPA: 3-deoxy-manno-octulosonate cytidylyltransferase [Bacteroidota bacterium]|nr:3-deoxy-manno-octulosonate cytidylyltransferase [Bacteroidota bacterium]
MLKLPTVIGVIPSRYASTRLPAKPLVDLLGKPMVQRVYERAQASKMLTRVIVATDDARIETAVKHFGGEVVLTSPDIKSGSDRVAAVAAQVAGDIFVNVQGDEPLLAPEMIDQAVQLLIDDPDVPVGTLAKKIETVDDLLNPSVVKVACTRNGEALYFSRAAIPFVRDEADAANWLLHGTFYKHIGLYVFRKDFLMQYALLPFSRLEHAERLEQLRILEAGYKIKVGITSYDSISVDTPEDAQRVVQILRAASVRL